MNSPISAAFFKGYDLISASEIIVIINQDFKIINCNSGFADFLKYEKDQVLEKELEEFIPLNEHSKTHFLVQNALSGQPGNEYISFRTINQKKKVGNVSVVPLFEDNLVTGVYCFIKDVSKKVFQNKTVLDSELRLKAIFENEPQCVKIVSVDGILMDINPAGLKLLEVEKDLIVGQNISHVIFPDDLEHYQKLHEQTCEGLTGSTEFRIKSFKGTDRWMSTSTAPLRNKEGGIYAVLSVTRDITQQKEADLKLQLSEQLFKNLVSNSSDIIVIIDENARFNYLSENVTTLLGYTPFDLIGKNAFDFIHPEDAPGVMVELKKVINKDDSALGIAHRFLHFNGQWSWLESKGINLLFEPSLAGVVINARDINDRIKLQQKLDLEMTSRQKQITAAIIETQEKERSQLGLELHDNVNQVLTTIKLYNEMLLEGMGDQKDILNRSVKHLQNCINEIRSISKRLSAPTLGNICVDDSVKELVESINLTNRLSIDYKVSGLEQCPISQDLHLAIYRIIQEQLNNILKYSQASEVTISICFKKGILTLVIQDNGKGFDTQKRRTGIGITNMISRAEHMGGSLTIDSELNKGTSLTVKFTEDNWAPYIKVP